MEQQKKYQPWQITKVKFFENWLVICVITYFFMIAGEIIGTMIIETPVLVLGVGLAMKNGTFSPEIFNNAESDMEVFARLPLPDWVQTSVFYFMFLGIWIFFLLMMFIKLFKPVKTALWTKTSGNTVGKFIIGFLIGLGMNGACILAAYLHGDIKLTFDSFRPLSFIFVLFCVFVQSSAEELVCRGFLYQMIAKNYKPWLAIAVNSLFFGALHLGNPGVSWMAILDIVVTGVLFSLMVYYMDSIWAAMAAHASWNFCQNIIFGLLNSGLSTPYSVFKMDPDSARNSFAYNIDFGVESTPFAIGIQVVVLIIILIWGMAKKKKPTDIWAMAEAERAAAAVDTVVADTTEATENVQPVYAVSEGNDDPTAADVSTEEGGDIS